MIEHIKVELGRPSDINSWMRLVRKVSWSFPGLETEQSIEEHKITVLKFMNDKRALCVKNEEDIVGVLLYSRKHNMICCLAVDPAYRMNILASRNRDSGAVETYIPDTETAFDWLNYHS